MFSFLLNMNNNAAAIDKEEVLCNVKDIVNCLFRPGFRKYEACRNNCLNFVFVIAVSSLTFNIQGLLSPPLCFWEYKNTYDPVSTPTHDGYLPHSLPSHAHLISRFPAGIILWRGEI
jgi:hypothetical protein